MHEAKIKETRFQVCQKVLAIIISRKRHEAIDHNKIKLFECELCQNGFAVKSNLEKIRAKLLYKNGVQGV